MYLPFAGNEPASDYNTWASGEDKPANIKQLRPNTKKDTAGLLKKKTFASKLGRKAEAANDDLDESEAEIQKLTQELAQLKATLATKD